MCRQNRRVGSLYGAPQLRADITDRYGPARPAPVGEASGELDRERLEWLDAELAALSHQPTLLAMHHPPIATGSRAWDEIGLPATDRIALGTVIRRHEQVRLIMAGHVHRTMAAELAGRAVVAIPSTYVQARLDLVSKIGFDEQRPGFALHVHLDGGVATQIEVLSQLPDGNGLG